ncbi:MAG: hypothetical protein IIZ36_00490 [Ruminococcus sp.]|nr:hypothetical protein [Ruminococcus sp.]
MSYFQRIKGFFAGVFLLLIAFVMIAFPEYGYYIAAAILGILLFAYGFKLLWFYFTMARNMVGGKTSLYQAIFILDLALFTGSVTTMDSLIIILYLLGFYAFSGFIDIMRAAEAKKLGAPLWKLKLVNGAVMILFSVVLIILGLFGGNNDLLVYGYSLSLAYSAVMRIVSAFRRTAIVYIQ